jgi:hypothetical protein
LERKSGDGFFEERQQRGGCEKPRELLWIEWVGFRIRCFLAGGFYDPGDQFTLGKFFAGDFFVGSEEGHGGH